MALLHIYILTVHFLSIHEFLFDNIVHIFHVHTAVGEIVGQEERFEFDGKQYHIRVSTV